jgi:glycosyltransferase involved in cell wall biosynthesis
MNAINNNCPRLSFVVPVNNEQETLVPLFNGIREKVYSQDDSTFEIIFIDDGSTDHSWATMKTLCRDNPGLIRAVRLRRNFGKATALAAGFRIARGSIVFTIDADLQDDPTEITKFLEKLDEGFDVVSGWKENRQDPLSKTLPSRLFNKVTAIMTGIPLHDFNCGYKAYRKQTLDTINLYGELHRYIPVLAHDHGFRIGEVKVKHHKREHGVTKYGWERYARGFVDLFTVLATTRYLHKPGHLFGGLGLLSGFLGFVILAYLSVLWIFDLGPIGTRPLFMLGILLVILSIQLLSIGLLAELITRHSVERDPDMLIAEDTGATPSNPKAD